MKEIINQGEKNTKNEVTDMLIQAVMMMRGMRIEEIMKEHQDQVEIEVERGSLRGMMKKEKGTEEITDMVLEETE